MFDMMLSLSQNDQVESNLSKELPKLRMNLTTVHVADRIGSVINNDYRWSFWAEHVVRVGNEKVGF